jgi:hypothetical protein
VITHLRHTCVKCHQNSEQDDVSNVFHFPVQVKLSPFARSFWRTSVP